ncbi:hypothetical protein ANCCEY_05041 [Ancylostoma ceylanicum]|uniref:Uncharacterized protein n=1 Tax=Ancylostoma ceylanicum TaxID=53326 RepID=A0A0D6M0L5_9BILA|nr:hypothetical protein ANCCEY_05041 [Ancylostoma ceylanicum]
MNPLPGLGSTSEKEGNPMNDVKDALSVVDVNALTGLHVRGYMTMHGLNYRSDSTTSSTAFYSKNERNRTF